MNLKREHKKFTVQLTATKIKKCYEQEIDKMIVKDIIPKEKFCVQMQFFYL